ncbi:MULTISPECIES: DUF4232 domain-containing protein [Actinosynnema]|uniref:DUF4232 domain-containing protein n=1 Tax=Actinosynnema pretiosum TaxID=42197 RepID=A0A290Z4X6_9PSEU|nr:DUF4232 domain-containing protein [Actinosynnema pretiosum]ATE54015.1 hypothetical protein CNX65_12525 [Actinosynnema pretiosum]
MSLRAIVVTGTCLVAAFAAGCGSGGTAQEGGEVPDIEVVPSGGTSSGAPAATQPPPAPTTEGGTTSEAATPPPASGPAKCQTAQLRIEFGQGNADMQGAHLPLRFTNTGQAACTLQGAPGVSYVTGDSGEQVGEPATRDVNGPLVTLNPGETASAGVFLSSAPQKTPDCQQVPVRGLRIYPPDNTAAAFVPDDTYACAPPLNGPFLRVGPVKPGPDNTDA